MSPQACTTRVNKVVVHGNGALVTRRGVVTAGAREILIEGLPILFSSDTLRVRPTKANGCTIGVVDEVCRVGVTAAAPVAGEQALLDVRLKIAALEQKRRVMKTLLDHVDASVELPPADTDGLPETSLLLRLAEDNGKRRRQLVREVRALDEQRRELAREEKRTAEQVRPDESPPRVLRGLRVLLGGPGVDGVDVDIEVEYFVPAARWVPSYSLHLTSTEQGTHARLVLGALVAQASGEDWDDVELLVSTADLRRETTLPLLHSWRLGRAQPTRAKGFRPLPSDLPALFSGWDRFPATPTTLPSTTTRAPAPSGPGSFEARSEGELKSFEQERTDAFAALGAAPAEMSESDDDDYDGADAEPEAAASVEDSRDLKAKSMPPRAKGAAFFAGAPQQAGASARAAPAPMNAPSGRASSATGMMFMSDLLRPEGGGGGPAKVVVVDELPPRLRTSAMRMSAADEYGTRGLLLPLDAARRLEWLLDAADVDGGTAEASRLELRRAMNALEAARRQLFSRALPRGTASVSGSPAAVFGATSSKAGARTSIPGDGNDHRVEVHQESGDAAILHLGVPRESLDVWRACRLKTQGPLPAGPVQVYEDGAFVVAGKVDGGGGGKPLTLNLGVDADVRIKARTPHTHQAEKGIMGGTTQIEQKVVVEVRSSRKVPVRLSLYERVPVADENQKDITVSTLISKPPAVRTDRGPRDEELKGGLRFDLTLMPGDLAVVEHSYTITLPAKSELVGGNRRE
ncbi:MAG: DUF4139 domain-containing protein [Deltaproteobacteria bacterium]|nr:DUF4139 domain-containing protein [Deltaproteobacteria bacterium]